MIVLVKLTIELSYQTLTPCASFFRYLESTPEPLHSSYISLFFALTHTCHMFQPLYSTTLSPHKIYSSCFLSLLFSLALRHDACVLSFCSFSNSSNSDLGSA